MLLVGQLSESLLLQVLVEMFMARTVGYCFWFVYAYF